MSITREGTKAGADTVTAALTPAEYQAARENDRRREAAAPTPPPAEGIVGEPSELERIAKELGCISYPGIPLKFVKRLRQDLSKAHTREAELLRSWDPATPTELQELDRLRRGWGPSTPTERIARHADLLQVGRMVSLALESVTPGEEDAEGMAPEALASIDAACAELTKAYAYAYGVIGQLGDVKDEAESLAEARTRAEAAEAREAKLLEQQALGKLLDTIRAHGWAVAVHNDYRLEGEAHTFWLFTKGDRAVKGEGRTDGEALARVVAAVHQIESPALSTTKEG